jgi:hypothetical protein
MEERKIPFLIESQEGHTDKLVPESEVKQEIDKQLADNKWVHVEKTDGSTEMITKSVEVQTKAEIAVDKAVAEIEEEEDDA